ncbi:MAG: protein kinase [Planctomycetes bacterium]|nr:protein kinase [Planctomycetota bacterium]
MEPETAAPDPAPRARSPAGDSFEGYEILSTIGEGGMGIVYRARQKGLGREVALKLLHGGRMASPVAVERFRREAEVIARLNHPNVIEIYDIRQTENVPFFTMRLVRGGSLRQALTEGRVGVERGARIVQAVALGLHHAHGHGVIHRDVKPENVLLDEDGTPVLTDFGLARDQSSEDLRTRTGAILGTPAYMAPEQATGQVRQIGPATDVYALGAILYEVATGGPPFGREASPGVLRRIEEDEPLRPRLLVPSLPRDYETIVLKCMAKSPARRYASAEELAADLGRFLAEEPIAARPVGSFERAARRIRRHKAVAITGSAGLLLALAVGGWFGTSAWKEARARREMDRERQAALEESERAARRELERLKRRRDAYPWFGRGLQISDALGSIDRALRPEAATEAIRFLTRAIEIDPAFAEAHYIRGRVREDAGEPELALADYRRACELEPGLLAARYRAGFVLAVRMVDHDGARREFAAIDRVDPESAYGHLGHTFLAIFERRLSDALYEAETAVAKGPYLPEAHFELGYVLLQLSEEKADPERRELLEGAERSFARALALRPGDAWGLNNRGIVRDRLDRNAEARADYDAAIELDPSFSSAYLNRGLLRWNAERDLDGALADLTLSLEQNPESARGWLNRGHLLTKKGDLQAAATDLAQAKRLGPEDPFVHLAIARLAFARDDLAQAKSSYLDAIRLGASRPELLDPALGELRSFAPEEALAAIDSLPAHSLEFPEVLAHRAEALLELGRDADALPALDRAIVAAPTPRLLQLRATLHERAGRLEEARADLLRILQVSKDSDASTRATGFAVLAQFHFRHEDYEAMLSAARSASEALPEWPTAHFLEGTALSVLSRHEEALAAFDRALALAPGDLDILQNRGLALIHLGRVDEGVAALRDVLAKDPDNAARKAQIGPILEAHGGGG